jgi:8-oxo-dGTP diphosphatase
LAQAQRLAARLGDDRIRRVVSSPSVRCVQTVEPLAARLGLQVESAPALAEGSNPRVALQLLMGAGDVGLAASTHGDVIHGLLWLLQEQGVLKSEDVRMKKASTWLLQIENGSVTSARYLPPP